MSSTSSPKNAERRKKLGKVGKGTLALVLVTGALSSGTYALWSQSATGSGGTITAGRLAVAQNAQAIYDVSQDRTDGTATAPVTNLKGHTITSLATYRTVPGDSIQVNIPVDLALEGDNLAADLTVDTAAATGTLTGVDGVTVTYDVYNTINAASPVKLNSSPIALGADTPFQFQATSVGQGGANPTPAAGGTVPIVLPSTTGGAAEMTVVVTAKFNDTANNNTKNTAAAVTAALGNIVTSFEQTRTPVVAPNANGFKA